MNSIKNGDLEPKKKNTFKRIFKSSLSILLIVFAFTMLFPFSSFQIIKPVMAAGTLTSVAIIPTNNIVNNRTTYEIFFKTATTDIIKTIQMSFPSGFDVSAATTLIERSGIGSGSLSAPSSNTLIYTVKSPVSVPAGTSITLEIGGVTNSDTAGSFKVSIKTQNTIPVVIDGPTLSGSFPIKDITGNDPSPNSMIRKSLKDDAAENAQAWTINLLVFFLISISVIISIYVFAHKQLGVISDDINKPLTKGLGVLDHYS